MSRKTYLRRCVGISLRHRASWMALSGLAGLLIGVLFNLSPWD